jgi:hypothetical protein
MQVKLRFNYRVHVSRMTLIPFRVTSDGLREHWSSSPNCMTHIFPSPHVTAGTAISLPTSPSLARIGLSRLDAIAVTHY